MALYWSFMDAGRFPVDVYPGWLRVTLSSAVPIGIAVYILSLRLVPATGGSAGGRLDVAGAVTVTASLMLAVYAIVNGNQEGWTSAQTLGLLGGAAVLMAAFLTIEARVPAPLVPLGLFRLRNLATANVVGVLWSAAMFAWFFISALYLQEVLGYTALQVGLAFLPATLIMGAFSISLSAKLIMRFGIKTPLATGLLLARADGEHQAAAVGNQVAGRVGFFLRVDDFGDWVEHLEVFGR